MRENSTICKSETTKIFFDCEFTGLHKDTTLISIGLVSECGERFYAEFNDYDENQVNPWIEKNVINPLLFEDGRGYYTSCDWFHWGSKEFIKGKLLKWLDKFGRIEWVADVAHYDFILLIDLLFENAISIDPNKYGVCCTDLNQEMADYYGISVNRAFKLDRESIVKNNSLRSLKHNSLYDAILTKTVYNFIK